MASISKRASGAWQNTSYGIRGTATDTIATLPTTIYSDGTNATVSIKGNTTQSGTPTPDNPVMPEGCGNKTANLFDIENVTHETLATDGAITYESAMNLSELIRVDGDYTVSWSAVRRGAYMRVSTYDDNKNFIARIVAQNTYTYSSYSSAHNGYIRINYENSYQLSDVQVNTGSTALPYEPFGVKIPISSADTTTNIYLGEVQSTRQIKKLVLTGQESWFKNEAVSRENTSYFYTTVISTTIDNYGGVCSHFQYDKGSYSHDYEGFSVLSGYGGLRIRISNSIATTDTDFKTYLTQQYANGTPVTVWYVLATETTGVVNEPLMKIEDYADEVNNISIPTTDGANTLSVDTTVQPSEVNVNYHGWHMGTVHERTAGQWD